MEEYIYDESVVKALIDGKGDHYVIPLYIRIGNKIYPLLEINEIDFYSESICKIGFGTFYATMGNKRVPLSNLQDADNIQLFNVMSDDNTYMKKYIIFESSKRDFIDKNDPISKDIVYFITFICDRINEIVNEKRKRILKDELG